MGMVDRKRLLLVRHGEYHASAKSGLDEGLTPRGRRQAMRLARYLSSEPITRVVSSTLERARETAGILHDAGGLPRPSVSASLREVLPSSIPGRLQLTRTARRAAGRQLDRAIEKYFRPRSHEVLLLVAHGNLIRALVCRVFGIDIHRWYRMGINHCSVTEIEIGSDGETFLIRFNDVGFMPRSMRKT